MIDAIPRQALLDRLAEWLKARRRRGRPEREIIPVHLHARPRLVITTDQGIFNAVMVGSCLYDDHIQFGFEFQAPADLSVGHIAVRFGAEIDDQVVPTETYQVASGQWFRVALSLDFTGAVLQPWGPPE